MLARIRPSISRSRIAQYQTQYKCGAPFVRAKGSLFEQKAAPRPPRRQQHSSAKVASTPENRRSVAFDRRAFYAAWPKPPPSRAVCFGSIGQFLVGVALQLGAACLDRQAPELHKTLLLALRALTFVKVLSADGPRGDAAQGSTVLERSWMGEGAPAGLIQPVQSDLASDIRGRWSSGFLRRSGRVCSTQHSHIW